MSGSATLTIVTSRRSMKVATETRTRVHHLRSIQRTLDGEVAELVTDASVKARAGQLGEATRRLDEADLQLLTGLKKAELLPVEGDFDRLAPRRGGEREGGGRGGHQGA